MIDSEIIENIDDQKDLNPQDLRDSLLNQLSQLEYSTSIKIHRIEIPIKEINIIKWLGQQSIDQKIYWSERSGSFEIGGIGQAVIW